MTEGNLRSPVVLIIFKRAETTKRIFETIRAARPSKLLVIADAPRPDRPGEAEKCEAARAIVEQVDWECEVLKNYAETNMGVAKRISSGLTWAFEQVEEAIILEDDCLPDPSFFQFCDELLERYRDNPRITTIAAQNIQLGRRWTPHSYYFSRYPYIWGWATWRRAWQAFDLEMKLWPQAKAEGFLQQLFNDEKAARYWTEKFQLTYDKRITSWAYPWAFHSWVQDCLTIIPEVNMVYSLGFDADAVHHTGKRGKFDSMPALPIEFPLAHPTIIVRNEGADQFTQNHYFVKPMKQKLRQFAKQVLSR